MRGPIDLFLGGDVMTGRGIDQILPHPSEPEIFEDWVRDAREYVALAERKNGPIVRPVGFEYVWGDGLAELRRATVRLANLETSVTRNDEPWPSKGINYRMHPRNVPCLTAAGLSVCVLGNNHVLDWGHAGLVETLETLHAAGLKTAGAGRNSVEAEEIAIVELAGGGRVLVVSVADPSSGVPLSWQAQPDVPGVALLEDLGDEKADAIGERIDRVRRSGDLVVASIHWGSNWGYEVEDEYVHFAHALVECGIDVVHGHSSHHPRPIEVHEGKPILYGCGDLINDYEGIWGYESFRNDLVLMYFLRLEDGQAELRMKPFCLRKMRLERASPSDAIWLMDTLAKCSRPYGTEIVMADDDFIVTPSPFAAGLRGGE